jgi:hypothetical protein
MNINQFSSINEFVPQNLTRPRPAPSFPLRPRLMPSPSLEFDSRQGIIRGGGGRARKSFRIYITNPDRCLQIIITVCLRSTCHVTYPTSYAPMTSSSPRRWHPSHRGHHLSPLSTRHQHPTPQAGLPKLRGACRVQQPGGSSFQPHSRERMGDRR